MNKEILCYRNNKIVLRVRCILNNEDLALMIKNRMIFYLNHEDYTTECIMMDNFDKVVIDKDIYCEIYGTIKRSDK